MIEWNEKYSLDVPEIDEDHKKLIDIINKAVLSKEHDDNPAELKEVLNEMRKYAQTHFGKEELYMIRFKYPEYQYHKEEHFNFITKIDAYENGLINADHGIASEILAYLSEWLINHIMKTDKKLVDCFRKNGLIGKAENQRKRKSTGRRYINRRSRPDRRSRRDRRSDTGSKYM